MVSGPCFNEDEEQQSLKITAHSSLKWHPAILHRWKMQYPDILGFKVRWLPGMSMSQNLLLFIMSLHWTAFQDVLHSTNIFQYDITVNANMVNVLVTCFMKVQLKNFILEQDKSVFCNMLRILTSFERQDNLQELYIAPRVHHYNVDHCNAYSKM